VLERVTLRKKGKVCALFVRIALLKPKMFLDPKNLLTLREKIALHVRFFLGQLLFLSILKRYSDWHYFCIHWIKLVTKNSLEVSKNEFF
jgi:hypothetical protein